MLSTENYRNLPSQVAAPSWCRRTARRAPRRDSGQIGLMNCVVFVIMLHSPQRNDA